MTISIPALGRASRRRFLIAASVALTAPFAGAAYAQDDTVTVGVVLPLSSTFADQGRHYEEGIKLYQKVHGDTVAGKKVEYVLRDDQGPGSGDLSRRLTQELILREGADLILGYSFTPNAMSAATLLTEAQTPGIIVNAATSSLTEKTPYYTRISMTLAQIAKTMGTWAANNGYETAYTIVSDYAPGIDAETWFIAGFEEAGGEILGTARTPLAEMEYSPFLQRAVEANPDVLFAFNPGGSVSVAFMKQAADRLEGTDIQLMVTGDVVDENLLPAMDNAVDGVISGWHYQADVDTEANKVFLDAFHEEFGEDAVPSFRAVQGYDGMALIYKALEATGGDTDADLFMETVKGMKLDSPRGPIMIDPETRDIVQNVYIRKGTMMNGKWVNSTFETVEAVKDPAKE